MVSRQFSRQLLATTSAVELLDVAELLGGSLAEEVSLLAEDVSFTELLAGFVSLLVASLELLGFSVAEDVSSLADDASVSVSGIGTEISPWSTPVPVVLLESSEQAPRNSATDIAVPAPKSFHNLRIIFPFVLKLTGGCLAGGYSRLATHLT